jgi:nickel-dependent lactate racemase
MDQFDLILEQFTQNNETDDSDLVELDGNLHYTDYHKNQGIEYIKKKGKITLDDPLIDELLELDALNIKTPVEEWEDKFGKIEKPKKKVKIVKCVKNPE